MDESAQRVTLKEFGERYELRAVSLVQIALIGLVKKEIILKEGNKYFLHDVLFSKWLKMYFQ